MRSPPVHGNALMREQALAEVRGRGQRRAGAAVPRQQDRHRPGGWRQAWSTASRGQRFLTEPGYAYDIVAGEQLG
jgi:hypothetical protein